MVGNSLVRTGGHLLKLLTISCKDFRLNKEVRLLKLLASFTRSYIRSSTEN